MVYTTITLPFAVLRNISRPAQLNSLEELYDFAVPVYDSFTDKNFLIYYQADIDREKLEHIGVNKAVQLVRDEIVKSLSKFSNDKPNVVTLSNKPNASNALDELLKIVLFDQPNRKSVIGSHKKPNSDAVATVNLKLPRGVSIYISPVRDWPLETHLKEAAGTVYLFGIKSAFFIRKARMNLLDHISKELLQVEFSKAMKSEFSFLDHYSGEMMKPWEAKLEFN